MKTLSFLTFFQLALSAVSAYLLSQMSWIGRMGINIFYQEYRILQRPLETGISIFLIQMIVVLLLFLMYRYAAKAVTNIFAIIVLILAIAGLVYTIYDFTQEFSHRILKSYFHVGGYLFWFGFIVTSLVYLFKSKSTAEVIEEQIEDY